jgi:hypothetical protein
MMVQIQIYDGLKIGLNAWELLLKFNSECFVFSCVWKPQDKDTQSYVNFMWIWNLISQAESMKYMSARFEVLTAVVTKSCVSSGI